jgi:hypothetical protein
MLPIERKELHPQLTSALLPLGLCVIIFFAAYKSGTTFLYFVGGFCAVLSILLLWFLKKSSIIIDDYGITAKTKISTREFLWKDITNTYVSEHFNGKRRVSYWNFETADSKKLSIPISHHSRSNLKAIADAVAAKCSHAQKDAKVAAMML